MPALTNDCKTFERYAAGTLVAPEICCVVCAAPEFIARNTTARRAYSAVWDMIMLFLCPACGVNALRYLRCAMDADCARSKVRGNKMLFSLCTCCCISSSRFAKEC